MAERWDLEAVWLVLFPGPTAPGVSVAPVGVTLQAGDVLAGIDEQSRRHLLIPLKAGEAARTNRDGRAVQLGRIKSGDTDYLTIFCMLPELQTVFTQFCKELLSSIESADSPAREAADAFERWRQLFSEAARGRGLTESALTGLVGELVALKDLLDAGAPNDLEFWTGPRGQVHDFRTVGHAIEVKATLVREGRIVHISSVDQLEAPFNTYLVLRHVRLEHDPSGRNLADFVEQAVDAGADPSVLDRLLGELGLRVGDVATHGDRRFRIVETRHYEVEGSAFPRVIRASFNGASLPPGILRLTYAIDLTNEPPHPLSGEAVAEVYSQFALGAQRGLDS